MRDVLLRAFASLRRDRVSLTSLEHFADLLSAPLASKLDLNATVTADKPLASGKLQPE
jgi:hypothetical protein